MLPRRYFSLRQHQYSLEVPPQALLSQLVLYVLEYRAGWLACIWQHWVVVVVVLLLLLLLCCCR
jgi:hypothetical protein